MVEPPPVVLVVDDDDYVFDSIRVSLRHLRPTLVRARTAAEALERCRAQPPAVAVVDVGLPDRDGYELVDQLHSLGPAAPARIVILTGHMPDAAAAARAGADAILSKPYRLQEFMATVFPPTGARR